MPLNEGLLMVSQVKKKNPGKWNKRLNYIISDLFFKTPYKFISYANDVLIKKLYIFNLSISLKLPILYTELSCRYHFLFILSNEYNSLNA